MKFLDRVYLDNSLRSYLVVLITIGVAFLVKRIISKYAAGLLFRLVKKSSGRLDKLRFNSLIISPTERLLFVLISFFALDQLQFPSDLMFTVHKVTSQDIVTGLASAIIIISFVSLLIRFVNFLVLLIKNKSGTVDAPGEYQLLFFFKDLIRVIIIIIGFIFILKLSFGLNIGNLVTGLSLVGAAMALAAKESIENLIASFVIFFDKPFATGDFVKVNAYSGNVERIGLRSTRLRTAEKSLVTVPNKQMVDSIVDNWSMRDGIRNELKSFLPPQASSEDLEKMIAGIRQILASMHQQVVSSSVFLQEINNDNAVITVIYFTRFPTPLDDLNNLREAINLAIRKLLEYHAINPPAATSVKIVK